MPYLLSLPHTMPDSHQCTLKQFTPELTTKPNSPKGLLMSGRGPLDPPGSTPQLTEEMRQNMPHTVFVEYVPEQGIPDISELDFNPMLSARVKDKLEQLEPGVHEFFPVEVKHVTKNEEYGTYYLIFINQAPDIIDHDRTFYTCLQSPNGIGEPGFKKDTSFSKLIKKKPGVITGPPLINFKEPGYSGHHLWRGTAGPEHMREKVVDVDGPHKGKTIYHETINKCFFTSDEFGDWIKAEKIRGSKPIKIIEEPPEWYYEKREKGEYL